MQSAKCCIKYMCKVLISALLHLFWFLPVQKNKILFMNDHSYTFSDNLKYLLLYLLDNDKNIYNFYFSLKDLDGITNGDIKAVKFLSLKHFYHALTSGVIITNNSGISYLPIRKKQLVINTWHGGGPYKVTGIENINNYWYKKDLKYNAKKTNVILSSCEVFSKVEAPGLGFSKEQILNCGMPRMDYFFIDEYKRHIRKKVFEYYHLSEDSRLVLYAPTFRGQFESYEGVLEDDVLEMDYRLVLSSLKERFGGDWIFALRLHPRLKNIQLSETEIINMTQYEDAEELLMASDTLITDYSSVMWDFSFSRKPIFLFATDINEYEIKRGFYIPPEQWPFPIATTNDEMKKNIIEYDYENYKRKLCEHYIDIGSYERGNSCQMVREQIKKHAVSIN